MTKVLACGKNIHFLKYTRILKKDDKTTNFPKQGIRTLSYPPMIFNINITFYCTSYRLPMTEVSAWGRHIHLLKYTKILKKDDKNNKFPQTGQQNIMLPTYDCQHKHNILSYVMQSTNDRSLNLGKEY